VVDRHADAEHDAGWNLSCIASGPQPQGSLGSTGLRPTFRPGSRRPRARVPWVVWAWVFVALVCGGGELPTFPKLSCIEAGDGLDSKTYFIQDAAGVTSIRCLWLGSGYHNRPRFVCLYEGCR
jgi:hypothetical protein